MIHPDVLQAMLKAGATAEMIVAAVVADQAHEAALLAERRAKAAAKKQRQRTRLKCEASPDVPGTKGDKGGRPEDSKAAELSSHLKKRSQPSEDTQLCMVEWIEEQSVAGENISETDDRMSPNVPGTTGDNGGQTGTMEDRHAELVPPASSPSPSDGAPSPLPPMVPPLLHLSPSLPPTPHPPLSSHTPASTPSCHTGFNHSGRGRAQADEPRLEIVEAEEVFEDRPSENPKASSKTQQACGKTSPRRATLCPDDFQPNAHHRGIVEAAGRSEAFMVEQRDMMFDWSHSDGNTKKDWDCTFNNWLRKAIATDRAQQSKYQRPGNAMTYLVEKERRFNEERAAQEAKQRMDNMFSMLRTGGLHG